MQHMTCYFMESIIYKIHVPKSVHRDSRGIPLNSWRYERLPALLGLGSKHCEYTAFYSPDNYVFFDNDLDNTSDIFCYSRDENSPERFDTNIAAIVGPGTLFDGQPRDSNELPDDLIVFVEIADSGVHWMEPGGDIDVRAVPDQITLGLKGKGLHVAFADAKVWFLDRTVPVEDIKKFFTIDGAKENDRDVLLGTYRQD